MEINKSSDINGVVTTEDITEGRMVLYTTPPGYPNDVTGRLNDVPGVKLPDTPAEAARADFVLTWAVSNMQTPILQLPWVGPHIPWSLRTGGMDRATNLPWATTVYMTYPGYQESMVIPSGMLALGFACCGGVFTVPSGQYVYSANLQVPGTRLRVCDAATDGVTAAGMLAETVSGFTNKAQVERFNNDFSLTFRAL